MKQANEEKQQILPEVVEVNTLFDSDLAEYEWVKEQEEKAAKAEAEAKAK